MYLYVRQCVEYLRLERLGADLAPDWSHHKLAWTTSTRGVSTNNEAHVSASNHSNPVGAPSAPPPVRIRTHGNEYESYEGPEDGHACYELSEQCEVCDMRHATAPHLFV